MSEAGVRLGLMLLQQANASMPEAASEAPGDDDALIEPHEGRGAKFWDVFLCLLPILLLVMTTVWKRVQMSTSTSLPLAAVLLWIIRLAYLELDANFTNAAVLYGLLDALKPLTIVTGAICLFQTMEATMCLPWIISRVRSLSSGHPVAEVFLIGWAFAYMIEGCSGFGTPVALAAPMLVSLGHPPVESICCCLIMNTLATVFGSVGFPVWFGFAGLDGIGDKDLRQVGLRAEVALFVCAHVVPVMAALFLVRWQDLKGSWKFVLLSIWAAKVPAVALALVSTDFSSLIGGMVALGAIGVMAKFNFGLNREPGRKHQADDNDAAEASKHLDSISDNSRRPHDLNRSAPASSIGARSDTYHECSAHSMADPSMHSGTNGSAAVAEADIAQTASEGKQGSTQKEIVATSDSEQGVDLGNMKEDPVDVESLDPDWGTGKQMALRTLPIWLTVLLLLITRIEPIGLRERLNDPEPNFHIDLGRLFKFELSASLVVRISDFLGLDGEEGRLGPLAWKYELLYIPFLLPFVASSIVTLAVFRKSLPKGTSVFFPFKESARRASKIAMALFGSLVLVSLLRNAEDAGFAPAYIIGHNVAGALQTGFVVCSAVLGALGSFFSGSTTVSNLTFGIVQQVAARKIGRSETALLALQAVGATAGNMICINNIISARTVVGGRALHVSEGAFIMKTAPALSAMLIIGTLMALPFIFS